MEKCKICGEVMKKVTYTHLKKKHNGMTKRQYEKLDDTGVPVVVKVDGTGEKLCRVCGKPYKRMRQEHLDKHGITKDEYESLPPFGFDKNIQRFEDSQGNELEMSATEIDKLIPAIKDIMLKRDTIDGQAKSVLQELFSNKESEFKLAINALAMHKLERMAKLLTAKSNIQDKLISDIDDKDDYLLLKILKELSDDVSKSESLFKDLGGMNPRVDNSVKTLFNILLSGDKREEEIPEKAGDRERALKAVRSLISIVEADDKDSES